MSSGIPPTILCVALPPEARPMAEHLELEAEKGHPFGVHRREDLVLVTSGPGRVRAAAACGYALGTFVPGGTARLSTWVNAGLAGHREAPRGSVFRGNRILGPGPKESGYPQTPFRTMAPGAAIRTVDSPETGYPEDTLYDMEASAVWSVAARASSAELVQFAKVVSDNRVEPVERWSRARVEGWMQALLPLVDELVLGVRSAALELATAHAKGTPDHVEDDRSWCLERWHFTRSLEIQLREGLRRRALLTGGAFPRERLAACRTAREVIAALQDAHQSARLAPARGEELR